PRVQAAERRAERGRDDDLEERVLRVLRRQRGHVLVGHGVGLPFDLLDEPGEIRRDVAALPDPAPSIGGGRRRCLEDRLLETTAEGFESVPHGRLHSTGGTGMICSETSVQAARGGRPYGFVKADSSYPRQTGVGGRSRVAGSAEGMATCRRDRRASPQPV